MSAVDFHKYESRPSEPPALALDTWKRLPVSAIVPVYNRADCVARCLDSIAAQTYPVSEIVVVDDASTDASVYEIHRWMSHHHSIPVRLIRHQKNQGGSAARNTAIKAATSDWIAFIDSDDVWHPEKLERQMRALYEAGKQASVAYAGLRHFDSEGRTTYMNTPVASGDMRQAIVGENVVCSTSSVIVRKDLVDRVGRFDETLPSCQDWDLWIRLARESEFVAVPEILVDYDASSRNRISHDHRARFRGHCTIMKRHTRPQGNPDAIASVHFLIGDILMNMKRPRAASRFFYSSWRRRPLSPKRAAAFLMAKCGLAPAQYLAIKRAVSSIRFIPTARLLSGTS
jgi:glycosyltransferase involved in cell wall biosynthesis